MANTLEDIKEYRDSVWDNAVSIRSEIWSLLDNPNQNPNQTHELETLRDGYSDFLDRFRKTNWFIDTFERSGLSADEINNQINNVMMPVIQDYEVYLENTNSRIKDILNSNSNNKNLSQEEIDALVQQHDNIAQSGQGYVETNTETVVNDELTSTTNTETVVNDELTSTTNTETVVNNGSTSTANQDNKVKTPLLRSFEKYFYHTSLNLLHSLDFAKSLIRFYTPKEAVPEDTNELLKAAKNVFENKIANKSNPDEEFARFVVDKVNQDPGLVTFDMIGDLVESDAYKNLGRNNARDKRKKSRFERWVLKKSMLAKMDENSPVNVVLAKDGMQAVIDELLPGEKGAKYKRQIDTIVKDFDDTFVEGFDEEKFNTLKNIIEAPTDSNEEYKDKLNEVFATLCVNPDLATVTNEAIETTYLGAETNNKRSVALCGFGTSANMCLEAVYKRVNERGGLKSKQSATNIFISENDLKGLYVSPLDVSKQQAKQATQSANNPSLTGNNHAATKLFAEREVFNDICTTFGLSVGGAALFSTIQNLIPGGNVISAIVGVGGVALQAINTGKKEYQKAKLQAEKHGNDVVSKKELTKIGWKTGLATLKGMAPYLVAEIVNNSKLGIVLRGASAVAVGVKTFWADLERSAGLNNEYTQAVQNNLSTGFKPEKKKKGLLKTLKDNWKSAKDKAKYNWKSAKEKGHLKSIFGHAVGKAAAVFAGSQLGRMAGEQLSESITSHGKSGDAQVDEQINNKLTEIDKEDLELTDTAGKSGDAQVDEQMNNKLTKIDKEDLELTDAARKTTFEENNRQYVEGKQNDWWNAQEQATALKTLQDNGLSHDDAVAVLRKMGSAAIFKPEEFQGTLDNLLDGNLSVSDVDKIIEAVDIIDRTGDLITSGKDLDLVIDDVNTTDNANLPEYENSIKTESVVSKSLDMVIDNVNTSDNANLPEYKNPIKTESVVSKPSDNPKYVNPLSKETVTRESYQIRYGKKVPTIQNQDQGLER